MKKPYENKVTPTGQGLLALRPDDLPSQDVPKDLLRRVIVEGGKAGQELVEAHTHRPPVHGGGWRYVDLVIHFSLFF